MITTIRGGKVYQNGRLWERDVTIEDGRIGAIGDSDLRSSGRVVDATGLWVLPGFVDAHFHCRAPGYPEREDFTSGSAAAASAGITTFFEMPISTPAAYNGEIIEKRKVLGEENCIVDFGLYAAPGRGRDEDISSAIEAGAIGFKLFLHAAPPDRPDEFEGLCVTDEEHLYRVLQMVAATGMICSVHAEDEVALRMVAAGLPENIGSDPMDHLAMRPPFVEDYATAKLMALAEITGARVHLAHMSAALSADFLAAARGRGIDVSGETCPHYLELDGTVIEEYGPYAKVAPPIKGGVDRAGMRTALLRRTIEMVVSDHSPWTEAEKDRGLSDIGVAPAGAAGVEMLGRYVLDQALRGFFPLDLAIDAISANPARRFGIADRKGFLRVGADADIVLFDPEGSKVADPATAVTKAKRSTSMWTGQSFKGDIQATFSRGEKVYEAGEVLGFAGWGRLVRPE